MFQPTRSSTAVHIHENVTTRCRWLHVCRLDDDSSEVQWDLIRIEDTFEPVVVDKTVLMRRVLAAAGDHVRTLEQRWIVPGNIKPQHRRFR